MQVTPIGYVHSCYGEKFGAPRQSGLVPSASAELILEPPYDRPEALRGIEGYSHCWLVFVFHRCQEEGWSATVRPPRLGGNRRMGVFATRSPYRPNAIGLSAVEIDSVICSGNRQGLRIRNHDLVDGTPVLDIKPYIPYSDALSSARTPPAFAASPQRLPVRFAEAAEAELAHCPAGFRELVSETLGLDPRPAYRKGLAQAYGVTLCDRNVVWRVVDGMVWVDRIENVSKPASSAQR